VGGGIESPSGPSPFVDSHELGDWLGVPRDEDFMAEG
jgi:hypothetical protein